MPMQLLHLSGLAGIGRRINFGDPSKLIRALYPYRVQGDGQKDSVRHVAKLEDIEERFFVIGNGATHIETRLLSYVEYPVDTLSIAFHVATGHGKSVFGGIGTVCKYTLILSKESNNDNNIY